jgi:hypothetical protein
MPLAKHIVPIGDRLVKLSGEFTDDRNEAYLIAHKALRRLLRNHVQLSDAQPADLREAVALAAEALGIAHRDKTSATNIDALIWPQRPDLVL